MAYSLYERTHAISYDEVTGKFDGKVIRNPKSHVHLVNGVAVNLESSNILMEVPDAPDAFMLEALGYGFLSIVNKTHLYYEQVAYGDTQWDAINTTLTNSRRAVDYFWIISDQELE